MKTARKAPSRPRGRRGLDRNAILDAAFDLLSRDGEFGFSVRKLGVSIGVDPMTVLHHFGSRDELLRRIADRALATVALPLPSADWRADLRHVRSEHAKPQRSIPVIDTRSLSFWRASMGVVFLF